MSTSTHSINEGITKIPNQSYFNHNKGNQPTPNIAFFNVYQPPNVIINININMDTPSNPQTENTIIGAEKPSTQCEDEKRYDCVDSDNSNKLIKERSLDRNNQNCDGNNIEDVSNMFASISVKEKSFQNSQVPNLMLNSSPANGIDFLENVPLETGDRLNDEKKLENVPVETDDRSNDENKLENDLEDVGKKAASLREKSGKNSQVSHSNLISSPGLKELLNSITNDHERFALEKVLKSPLKDLSGRKELYEMINTEGSGQAIFDIMYSSDLKPNDQDITNINLAFAGGGDPARYFIDLLVQERPNLPITDLINALEENKVCYEKLELKPTEGISKLGYFWKKKLCVKLNFDNKWRGVASSLSYNQQKINLFKSSQKRGNNYCAASEQFSQIHCRQPSLSIESFMDILLGLKLESIYQHMVKMVKQEALKTRVPSAEEFLKD